MPAYQFIQAKNYRKGGNLPVNRLVLHSMEAPEKGDTAEAVARYFASGAVVASCHYMCDNDSIVAGVHEEDTAYHAPPNAHSVGIEHAGYASQGAADWADPYSEAMLHLSATLAADICRRHDLPIAFVPAADLLAGKRGITTHVEVSRAWHQSDHTDPGPNFPMVHYLDLVRAASGPQEVKPMWDPPLQVVDFLPYWSGSGGYMLFTDGGIGAVGDAPYRGPDNQPLGHDYWLLNGTPRRAARIARLGASGYSVTAVSGEVYNYP
jgi:N-acetylmuramoyl-L-alanine amidase